MIIKYQIQPEQEGTYFTIAFEMPSETEALTLSYHYDRFVQMDTPLAGGSFSARQEVNVIDLGLIAPDGRQVGASGSDKNEITLRATEATPGYRADSLAAGEWKIIVGAYHVAPQGVTVTYELRFTPKELRLYKGDLHTHTVASDGVLTAAELGWHAYRHGLDFVAITDHNQIQSAESLPKITGFTFIQGVEWTHYQGHANFLGVDQPYDAPFPAQTPEEVTQRFALARSRGALAVINHPFDENCSFHYDWKTLAFDCLEVWNGPMRESNLRAVGLWHQMLCAGYKIPAIGGSDYHRDNLFQILGGPTTGVYAASASAEDILDALKHGHAFITFSPKGPTLKLTSAEAMMGDTRPWAAGATLNIKADGLVKGDALRVITPHGAETLFEAPAAGQYHGETPVPGPGFVRIEILRSFLPGLPALPALISNPIYFEGG